MVVKCRQQILYEIKTSYKDENQVHFNERFIPNTDYKLFEALYTAEVYWRIQIQICFHIIDFGISRINQLQIHLFYYYEINTPQ